MEGHFGFLLFIIGAAIVVLPIISITMLRNLQSEVDAICQQLYALRQQLSKISVSKEAEPPKTIQATVAPAAPLVEKKKEEPPILKKDIEKPLPPVVTAPPVVNNRPPLSHVQLQEDWWTKFKQKNPDIERFIGENIINKIGIALLVLGIGFFVKYAIDKNWINEIARVGIGVLCGTLILGLAYRLRNKFKSFSSVLTAGAIAVFYFTIAIGFQEYQLFSQPVAFIIMVCITAFSIFISTLYNRKELAIISLIGGFLVPFMVSSDNENYKVLFTYILVLDVGMLILSYLRKWNLVNLLAFIFTVVLYGTWFISGVVFQSETAPYSGALLFATLFYVVFMLMNIANSIKENRLFTKMEFGILLSNTSLYYVVGMIILSSYYPAMRGLYTALLAVANLLTAIVLHKKFVINEKTIYLFLGLTLTFVTLVAPVQLEGNYITLFWSVEALLLMALSFYMRLPKLQYVSGLMYLLAFISLVMDWCNEDVGILLFNKLFITGIIYVASLYGSYWLLRREKMNYTTVAGWIAIATGYVVGLIEVTTQTQAYLLTSTAVSLSLTYHFLFSAVLIYFTTTNKILKKEHSQFIAVLCSLNSFLYIMWYIPMLFQEAHNTASLAMNIGIWWHYLSLAAMVYTGVVWLKRVEYKKPLTWFLCALGLYVASSELLLHGAVWLTTYTSSGLLVYTQIVKVGFPILWGVCAFLLLFFGIKSHNKTLRIIALTLLAATMLKLFVYDISNVSEAGKILAFILLGVALLVMSFMYQKIKSLILED